MPSQLNNGPHAFDLTWRNYIPSASQFYCCFQRQDIRLEEEDDHFIDSAYYNDHYTLYQGDALQDYLDNPRDWEFEAMLSQNELAGVATRSPSGTSRRKFNKKKKMNLDNVDLHCKVYKDADFFEDDQITHLAHKRPSKSTNEYGEEVYYNRIQEPAKQKKQVSKEFYAAKTMPNLQFSAEVPPTLTPESHAVILNDQLKDLTERLSFIKISALSSEQEGDETSLHTLRNQQEDQARSISDIDSVIASEALDEYENTNDNSYITPREYPTEDELQIPSLVDNAPFASDQHPFSFFANRETGTNEDASGTNFKDVFNLRRNFFGI